MTIMDFEQTAAWNALKSDLGAYYTEAVEQDRESLRKWLKGLLNQQPVLVEFVKADGNVRTMNCTLSTNYGAEHKIVENTVSVNTKPPAVNNDVCKVWDIDQRAWRSFRWDRLKKVGYTIG